MSDIQIQLKEKIQELETIRKIKTYTAQLQTRLMEEQNALDVMGKTLDKEQRDVELLEKEGLTTMFHKFLGDREAKLDKERKDYLTASLRYNELYKSVHLIQYELDLLSKKEQNQRIVEGEIDVLMKQREEELLQHDPEIALQLRGINDQVDKLHKFSVEVEEAFNAGTLALDRVQKTEYYLHSGQNRGQREMWGGRRQRSYYIHQAVDYARDMAYQSKQALIKFGNELKDVYSDLDLHVNMEIEEFGKFVDVFFESIITDWMVQQKINKSLINVSATRQQVERLVMQLDQERRAVKSKLEQLEKQRKQTIISANS